MIDEDASSSEEEQEPEEDPEVKKQKTMAEMVKEARIKKEEWEVKKEEDRKEREKIWEKRTVGAVLETAVAAYWQRRAERESRGG